MRSVADWVRGPFRRAEASAAGGEAGGEGLAALAARSLAGGGWVLLTMGLATAVGVARTLVVAHLLGPREMGVMAIALLALGTVEAVTATGIETALVTHPGDAEADLDAAFTLQALRGLLVAAAVWIAAPPAAAFFGAPAAAPVVRAVGAVALLRGLANPAAALLVRRIEFGRLFWWSVPEQAAAFGLAVGFALARRDVWALVIAAVGAQAVATAASYAMIPRRPKLTLRGEGTRRLFHYGKWVNGTRTLMFLSVNADNAVVGRFLGTGALGTYQLAFRVAELGVATFTQAAVRVALPALGELRESPERLRRAYRAVLRLVVAANCVFAVVLAAGGALVGRVLGPEWAPAVPVIRILAVAMVFRAVVVVASELFNAVGRPQVALWVNAARLAVMLATIVPLMRLWGVSGVAVSVLLASLAAALLCVGHARSALDAERG